jgi:hypothetical protein
MERFPVSGVKVYQLEICEAIGDHDRCPGMGRLSVDGLRLGPVGCKCPHHLKPEEEIELPSNQTTSSRCAKKMMPDLVTSAGG